ncbi:HsdM family class I SAM-dependent methyltransferase [Hufsiella ginkgonis]|uniref:site-specific DNA-methyltransferase (adenine-specific) n=1 Tax=Hufsiella ginkgonis TaxID=2695274 RepID=A0A7K1Y1W6_9SPHI|nr:Eco57I restriction-modification methylase domain-containing protein [Hufsiella ginkgonis]MXV17221.1 N-6 DNA methylase [Hufsiella ginkgonis]
MKLLFDNDPAKAIESGRTMAVAWFKKLSEDAGQIQHIHSFMFRVMAAYWSAHHLQVSLPAVPSVIKFCDLDSGVIALAEAVGKAAAQLEVIDAGYQLGTLYTSILPPAIRSANGIFYTPPPLTRRMLSMVKDAGADYASAKFLDPACGGGAFLAPIVMEIVAALPVTDPETILTHIEAHVQGFDTDAFGGWLTQIFVETTLKEYTCPVGRRLKSLVKICDSLSVDLTGDARFDVIIGNPPYGKVKLTDTVRERFSEGLYGHANLYSLFIHLSLNLVKTNGIVALLTPTSFLSGEYFKNIRQLIRSRAAVSEVDFVSHRKGVFDDVLQETMLSVFRNGAVENKPVSVNEVTIGKGQLQLTHSGKFNLSSELTAVWLLPRRKNQCMMIKAMTKMTHNLTSWGYRVSTGPLVWNRNKSLLTAKQSQNGLPVIWAESITPDGRFEWKAGKKNHMPYFRRPESNPVLVTVQPCILLQRTTAKEQHKRLICGYLPAEFIKRTGGVVVENHLNMIIPSAATQVAPEVLNAFLNSKTVNDAFRCISGSVAVSAFELESLPLPKASKLNGLSMLVQQGASGDEIERECRRIYRLK